MNAHVATEAAQAEIEFDPPKGGEIAEVRGPQSHVSPQAASVMAPNDPILALIRDPTLDLDRVKAVMALRKELADEESARRREIEQEQARRAFNAAMVAVKQELPIVIKKEENKETHSKHATLGDIGEAVDSIIAKHGFSTSFFPTPGAREGYVKVECIVAHGGHERHFEAEVPLDVTGPKGGVTKTAIHGWRSAITYARKTLYEMIFDVKLKKDSSDDDGNAAGRKPVELITAEQAEIIRELIGKTKANLEALLQVYKAESIPDIRASDFERLHKQLEKKLAAKVNEAFK